MASGPSLTLCDVEKVRRWRSEGSNRAVIVTNTTYQIAPWADALYAMDTKWWLVHQNEVASFGGFKLAGKRRTTDNCPVAQRIDFDQGGNSGAGAMLMAKLCGADKLILLGYDCQYSPAGKRHWHGDHPRGLGNCVSMPKFYGQFQESFDELSSVDVVNASRSTALDLWPRQALDDALSETAINPLHHCYWRANVDLKHLTPGGIRFPEAGLFDALRELCQGSVFEVGCGDGRLSPAFDASLYTGMDVNPAALERAKSDNPEYHYTAEWHMADAVLAYTVLLHISDADLPRMMDELKKYPRIIIGEIMGRKWRTQGEPPVFNRELSEYESYLGPVKKVIRVPYAHYDTDLELCLW